MTQREAKKRRKPKLEAGEEFVCVCECGGNVIGVRGFDRLWTICDKCSPVVEMRLPTKRSE